MDVLKQPVTALSGIGGQTASRMRKLGIHTVGDLLWHLPHRYEDRTRVCPIASASVGMSALVCGKVALAEVMPTGRRSLVCKISDGTGELWLRFFHFTAGQTQQLKTGAWLSVFAEVRYGFAGLEMVHPEYAVLSHPDAAVTEDRLTPVYPTTEGLSQKTLRKAVQQALALCLPGLSLNDGLPAAVLRRYGLPPLAEAVPFVHAPDEAATQTLLQCGMLPATRRLAFEELLAHHLSLRSSKDQAKRWPAPDFFKSGADGCAALAGRFLAALPFRLTRAQRRVIAEIEADCRGNQPMLRLVQGDVGSGKTIVAAYAALLALSAGYQVAVMAPTELLAEQHFRNFSGWFAGFEVRVGLLTGQLKGAARADLLQGMADGGVGIAIGTHALFQEQVQFNRLGLVVIDEQHRFGVHQRLALREKAQVDGIRPHQLVMTATPIPRTLAMLSYADLDLSVIDELPPGRKPVVTRVIPAERRDRVVARIASWVAEGRQAYWVCTLIEESEQLQCEAAEITAGKLRAVLPAVRIGLLHGRMKAGDKETVMQAFKNRQLDLLVATTVIEVGVDVPNAGLMIIENPERLGLAQLHQLRGRVGRGGGDSYCLLLYQAPLSDTARQRLGILRDSNDGFVIAEKDLQLRGPGDVIGTRQTGLMRFKVADLSRDAELLEDIRQIADEFFTDNPDAVQTLRDRWLGASADYSEV